MAASTSRVIGLAVFNLSWTCIRRDLRTHFSKYGIVQSVSIPMDFKTGFNKGMGFVKIRGQQGIEEKIFQDYHTIDHQEFVTTLRLYQQCVCDTKVFKEHHRIYGEGDS